MGLFGTSTYTKQARVINDAYNYNNNLIQAEKNADPLQRGYAQEMLTRMKGMLEQGQKNAAATAAVAGGSAEYLAAQKQAAAQQAGQLAGNITAQASNDNLQLMQADIANKNQQAAQLSAARAAQGQRRSQLISDVAGLGNSLISGYFGAKNNDKE